MADVVTERLGTEQFIPSRDIGFEDVFNLKPLFDRMHRVGNVVLVGPKGVGKSAAFYAWAREKQHPIVTVDCSEDLRRSQLMGSYTLRGQQTPFVLGPIPTAFDIANEKGFCILNLEELNALSPQAQKLLNPVLDFRKRVELPEAQRVFELRDGAVLWVTGSMNTAGYGGTHQLNEDLRSRVNLVQLDYPESADERKMVRASVGETVFAHVNQHAEGSMVTILDGLLRLAKETRQPNGFDYALAPRDVVQVVQNHEALGLVNAMRVLLGKFEGDHATSLRQRIVAIFPSITLKQLTGEGT